MITQDRKVTIDADLVVGHTYEVAVRAITVDGRVQAVDTAPMKTLLIQGVTSAPEAPTGLVASPMLTTVFLVWVNPADVDLDVVEVWYNTTDDSTTAVLLGEVRGDSFSDYIGSTGTTRYYWVKARNTSGVVSGFNATAGTVAVTTGVTATDIDDFATYNTQESPSSPDCTPRGSRTTAVDPLRPPEKWCWWTRFR